MMTKKEVAIFQTQINDAFKKQFDRLEKMSEDVKRVEKIIEDFKEMLPSLISKRVPKARKPKAVVPTDLEYLDEAS